MNRKKRILIAPLDWGLGHATRCIPIVRKLLTQGAEIVIGADKGPLKLLQQEFPNLEFITMSGYDITYPKSGNMTIKMLLQVPKILKSIKAENELLDQIIEEHKVDAVISDNRYGLHSEKVPCVFITHQIHIQTFMLSEQLYKLNKSYIDKFTECWIPDLEGSTNLSGALSHAEKIPDNACYIGSLSRFTASESSEKGFNIMAIVSGPEPQRSAFEKLLIEQLKSITGKKLLVRGLPNETEPLTINNGANITIKNHLPTEEMQEAILSSNIVVCRPGYSSLMDLATLGKPAIFIPTPGQTEQEYLAKYHYEKLHYFYQLQSEFNLNEALEKCENYNGIQLKSSEELQKKTITNFLNGVNS